MRVSRYPVSMLSRVLRLLPLAFLIAFVFWVCVFKVFDADFFWHVTAGKLMRTTGGLIVTDPFAWTRAGLPYLANHEWLAQIVLSLVLDAFGATGVIVLRSLMVSLALSLPVLIGWRRAWAYVPLAMLAALVIKGGAMDRPHLWTWVMVGAFLFVSASVLMDEVRSRKKILTSFIALFLLQVLWVNLHGGAALLGVVIGGAVSLQLLLDRWRFGEPLFSRDGCILVLLPLSLVLALMVSPLGWENLTYVQTLLTDRTTQFIAEWQPRPWGLYLRDLWPFWVAALASIALARRHLVFSVLVLLVFGFLSRQAYRHEMLFVIAVLVLTIAQLEQSEWWQSLADRISRYRWQSYAGLSIIIVALTLYGRTVNRTFASRYNAHGYGIVDRTADSVAFLAREEIDVKAFNTYGLGSELLSHGLPVFIDGRNVDYGEEFLSKLFAAADDVSAFRILESEYGFTVALLDLAGAKTGTIPYVASLDSSWALVYVDDAVAAYVKNVPAHADLISRLRYRILTPENFISGKVLGGITDFAPVITELTRAAAQAPSGVQARVLLGRALVAQGNLSDASSAAAEAVALRPDDYRGYELFGLLYARAGEYDKAEIAFDEAINRLSRVEAGPLKEYVARIFEGVGESERAKRYR